MAALAISGPFGGSSGGASVDSMTPTDVRTVTLGEPFSLRALTLTEADATKPALEILNGRLYMANRAANPQAYIQYVPEFGWTVGGSNWFNCPGCMIATDSLYSRQMDRPVSIDQAHGLRLAPQASVDACGTTAAPEGTVKTLAATASSATRTCRCILTQSGGNYRWLNDDTNTRGTTTSDCPETTP
jgi:hypothetical protein